MHNMKCPGCGAPISRASLNIRKNMDAGVWDYECGTRHIWPTTDRISMECMERQLNGLKDKLVESNWRYRDLVEAMGVTSHQSHLDIVKRIQDQAAAELERDALKASIGEALEMLKHELDRLVAEKKGK